MTCYHNTIFYTDADYEGFDTPLSEGGKGPENARDVLGLECWHHYGFTPVVFLPGETAEEAAYRHVRETHHFLTDDNHTWKIDLGEKPHWASSVDVTKNEKSGYFAMKPSWVQDGPGAHWFSQDFRVATVGMVTAEIEADRRRTKRYLDEAASQRDTIRGRKRAWQLRSFAIDSRWLAEGAPGERWPQFKLEHAALAA
jgi:hypothetical protein